jgi:hypothetical protein
MSEEVIRIEQNNIHHMRLQIQHSGGFNYHLRDHHQHCAAAQMQVLDGVMGQLNLMTSLIYQILESGEDYRK